MWASLPTCMVHSPRALCRGPEKEKSVSETANALAVTQVLLPVASTARRMVTALKSPTRKAAAAHSRRCGVSVGERRREKSINAGDEHTSERRVVGVDRRYVYEAHIRKAREHTYTRYCSVGPRAVRTVNAVSPTACDTNPPRHTNTDGCRELRLSLSCSRSLLARTVALAHQRLLTLHSTHAFAPARPVPPCCAVVRAHTSGDARAAVPAPCGADAAIIIAAAWRRIIAARGP